MFTSARYDPQNGPTFRGKKTTTLAGGTQFMSKFSQDLEGILNRNFSMLSNNYI